MTPGVLRGVKAGNVDPATLVFVAAVGKGTVAEGAKFAGAGVIVAEPVDEIVPAGRFLMLLPVLVPVGPVTWSREIRGRALFVGPSFSRAITDIGIAR